MSARDLRRLVPSHSICKDRTSHPHRPTNPRQCKFSSVPVVSNNVRIICRSLRAGLRRGGAWGEIIDLSRSIPTSGAGTSSVLASRRRQWVTSRQTPRPIRTGSTLPIKTPTNYDFVAPRFRAYDRFIQKFSFFTRKSCVRVEGTVLAPTPRRVVTVVLRMINYRKKGIFLPSGGSYAWCLQVAADRGFGPTCVRVGLDCQTDPYAKGCDPARLDGG